MNRKVMYVTEKTHSWVMNMAREKRLRGSFVIDAAIDRAANDKKFLANVADIRLQKELGKLEKAKLRLVEKEKELKKRLKQNGSGLRSLQTAVG